MAFLRKRDNCCNCLNLRNGTLTILWSGMIFGVFTSFHAFRFIMLAKFDNTTTLVTINIAAYVFILTEAIFNLIPHSIAMYGCHKRKSKYFKPYLFLMKCQLLFGVILLMALILISVFLSVYGEPLEVEWIILKDKLSGFGFVSQMAPYNTDVMSLDENEKFTPPISDVVMEHRKNISNHTQSFVGKVKSILGLFIVMWVLYLDMLYYFGTVVYSYRLQMKKQKKGRDQYGLDSV